MVDNTARITGFSTHDIRFPTSLTSDGSDAVNRDPNYSAAYVVLQTDQAGLEGHGLTFTIGRGNQLCVSAIEALAPRIMGMSLGDIAADMAGFWRHVTGDSQLRWVGPEKGVIHLGTAALINAVWDLVAKAAGKPLWKLVADMSPEEIIAAVDFTYLGNALTPNEALGILEATRKGRGGRLQALKENGYPAYTTSTGWLGYSEEKVRRLAREAVAGGWTHFKIKVGRDLEDDKRRCAILREEIGASGVLMIDANQIWEVDQAIGWVRELTQFNPWFIEEPTSPDDILGHKQIRQAVAPIKVATGEMCHNKVMFKQFLQAGALDIVQIDAARTGGLNEQLAILLLAAKYNKPVCPHAGGAGLCEYVQHLSAIDYLCISGSMEGRIIEYVDHLHEHFLDPCVIDGSRYRLPTAPGYSIEMKAESIAEFTFKG